MSARKWPFYTMAVGETFVHPNPGSSFLPRLSRYAAEHGKRFRTRRAPNGRVVKRIA